MAKYLFSRRMIAMAFLAGMSACGSSEPAALKQFDREVGPPFGLAGLRGTMTRTEARVVAPMLVDNGKTETAASSDGAVVATVSFPDDRVGDIEVTVKKCDGMEEALRRRWGSEIKETMQHATNVWLPGVNGWAAAIKRDDGGGCRMWFSRGDLLGDRLRFSGALADLKVGMVVDAAHASLARVHDYALAFVKKDRADHVATIRFEVSPAGVGNLLQKWSNRVVVTRRAAFTDCDVAWFDEPHHMRGRLDVENRSLHVDSYQPLQQWLGAGELPTAFPTTVFGRLPAELAKEANDHPSQTGEMALWFSSDEAPPFVGELDLPPTEWTSAAWTEVKLTGDSTGRIAVATFRIATPTDEAHEQAIALLRAKWPPATAAATNWTTGPVRITDQFAEIVVELGATAAALPVSLPASFAQNDSAVPH